MITYIFSNFVLYFGFITMQVFRRLAEEHGIDPKLVAGSELGMLHTRLIFGILAGHAGAVLVEPEIVCTKSEPLE